MGITIYKFIIINHKIILAFVQKVVIQGILFDGIYRLIRWVSVNHPAGFKLNNELGQFMGDLYLWSLKFWKYLINDFLQEEILKEVKQHIIKILLQFVKFICYFGGVSFLIASVIDVIKILRLHISGFYQTASKIYNKQIEVLKSLFQLFRGKKYNVLRNRIDNLNNYSVGDSFEIVQFLMGTLIFMILVLLLPTVFAFYLTFFLLQLIGTIAVVYLEWLQIVATCSPLFMILLKVKNSNRLQGGVKLELLQSHKTTAYVQLSNKSLGYNEIFKNFIKLFKNCTNFRASLIHFFFIGELISIDRDSQLKFNYLMLPDKYEETVNIWKIFSTKGDTYKI
jgi:phosphatidylinositol glycan class Q protein